jgi:hypothetical protein
LSCSSTGITVNPLVRLMIVCSTIRRLADQCFELEKRSETGDITNERLVMHVFSVVWNIQ